MNISKNSVVEIEYTLKDGQGTVIDSSNGQEPLAYLHGHDNIVPGLERELEGRKTGDQLNVVVSPGDAYGDRDEAMVTEVPRDELAQIPNLQVGVQLQAQTPQGVQIFTVSEIDDKVVTLDANHPLAGLTLHFDVKVVNVREATQEEIAHGHVHGPHGHDH